MGKESENSIIAGLDKAFNNRIRVGIMAILVVNDWVDFNSLKDLLGATDGNLSSHLSSLEKHNYINYKKEFILKKPKTSYRCTAGGREAFEVHIKALEDLLNTAHLKPNKE